MCKMEHHPAIAHKRPLVSQKEAPPFAWGRRAGLDGRVALGDAGTGYQEYG